MRVSNSDHVIGNNNNALSYVIRREQRLALKHWSLTGSLTAYKERSWFELTITKLMLAHCSDGLFYSDPETTWFPLYNTHN